MPAPESPPSPQTLEDRIADTKQRLIAEFQARVSVQVIEETTVDSLEAFRNATVHDFVPLFVEREARERLQAQFK
jgi:hypothetical protein